MRSALILLLVMVIAGCGRGHDKDAQRTTRGATADKPAQPVRKAIYQEPDAVAILRALDSGQIKLARVARDVSQNDEVLRYAAVMLKDHSDILHLVDSTGVMTRDNAVSGRIGRGADSIATGLARVTMGFNNTFIEEQVRAHQQALALLDTAIIPSVTTPQLKTLLTELRPTYAAHLQRAMQILAQRRREAEDRHEPWVSGLQQVQARPDTTARRPDTAAAPAPAKPDTSVAPPTTTQLHPI